jgi:hypothetical protein
MTDTHITIMMALCQWWQIHITILIALPLCQWWQICILLFWWHWHCVSDDRYAYYYSDVIAVVSVMTDMHITILIALALYQWWQIHTLLFWWHWHCVHDNRYIDYYSDRYFMPKIYSGPNRISLVCQKNLKREIRWNYFGHNKLFRHLILLPGLVYKADHTP